MAEGQMSVVRDLRRVRRGGPELVAERQRARLADMVAHARAASPLYQELYRDLPDRVEDVTALPITSAESLPAQERARIRKTFDAKVRDQYAAPPPTRCGPRYASRCAACSTATASPA